MKYVVIYSLDNIESALCFDTHNDAVDYINACSRNAAENLHEMTTIGADLHKMTLKNGKEIRISIKSYPDSQVRFDLSFERNGRHVETRRFTRRQLAANYANKILDEQLDCYAEENEDFFGEWSVDIPENNLTARLTLSLVILDEKSTSDYDLLDLKPSASPDEVKQAFRKMAIKYHPDKGGDPEKFQKIHTAYERILRGASSKSSSQKILETFGCIDMRRFFANFKNIQSQTKTEFTAELQPILREIRTKASGLVARGFIEMLIGGLLTAASYGAASPGGMYVIFYGIIFLGIRNFFKGLYYLANPKALLKKSA